jgi:hypothetical protein
MRACRARPQVDEEDDGSDGGEDLDLLDVAAPAAGSGDDQDAGGAAASAAKAQKRVSMKGVDGAAGASAVLRRSSVSCREPLCVRPWESMPERHHGRPLLAQMVAATARATQASCWLVRTARRGIGAQARRLTRHHRAGCGAGSRRRATCCAARSIGR